MFCLHIIFNTWTLNDYKTCCEENMGFCEVQRSVSRFQRSRVRLPGSSHNTNHLVRTIRSGDINYRQTHPTNSDTQKQKVSKLDQSMKMKWEWSTSLPKPQTSWKMEIHWLSVDSVVMQYMAIFHFQAILFFFKSHSGDFLFDTIHGFFIIL